MVEYDSAAIYIQSATSIKDKINKIDTVISALMDAALKAASNEDITEYSLDNGQTKIKCIYRGSDSALQAIKGFEQIKNMYINQLNGRSFRLVDAKSFRNYGR
jgi:hypothetical protein